MSNGNGVEAITVPCMTITVDPRTMAVTFKCTEAPIYFWQMVLSEVGHQLEDQRRATNTIALMQQVKEQQAAAALRGNLKL